MSRLIFSENDLLITQHAHLTVFQVECWQSACGGAR